jgi:tetratricopeptide (TPR) repeat protein
MTFSAMSRLRWVIGVVWVLGPLSAWAAGPGARRPVPDEQAMREAMNSSLAEDEQFSSSASYAHYLRARLAHHDGDHRRALDELRLALASDDANPFLVTSLAEEYARLSELGRAERELRKVIERDPTYQPAQLLMGRILFEGQKFTRAKVHLGRAIRLSPKDPDGYLILTQLWLEQGKPDEAMKVVEELSAALPGEPIGYKRLGLALAERSDYPRAEKLLKRATEKDPGDFECWVALAQVFESTSRPGEAEEAYSRALQLDPESREVLLAAGRLALRQDSASRAKGYFDQLLAVSADPEVIVKVAFSYLAARQLPAAADVLDAARLQKLDEPRLSFYAGLVHEKLGRYLRAADAYAEVPKDAELFHEARLHRAGCLSLSGAHHQALELFRAGLAEKPDYLPLYPAYARALERSGAPREAEAFLVRSSKERPVPEIFEALANTFERQGKLGEAIALLVDALSKRPRDEVLLYTLGAAYEKKGETARALAQMRAVLDLNPENANAMNFIGYTLAEQGVEFDEAERLLGRALELKPDSGSFLDSLGWVYYRRGDTSRAVETLERAAALAPGEPTILEHLGDAYRRATKKAQAQEAYRKALEALKESTEAAEARTQRAGVERKLKMLSTDSADR